MSRVKWLKNSKNISQADIFFCVVLMNTSPWGFSPFKAVSSFNMLILFLFYVSL